MKNSEKSCLFVYLISLISICFIPPPQLHAGEKNGLSDGQTIYVPAYSHIYSGSAERPFLLTVIISIRNTDPKHRIELTVVYCII
ncbi:MAG: DUF3124 domain-containing protein [bacterium]|nr:DUF3124 domain-containing protein [bacterium]